MGFDLQNYETVEERLVRWHAAYPDSQIITIMVLVVVASIGASP